MSDRKPRLNREQYLALETQYEKTPPLFDGASASGEHYQLAWLLHTFGFRSNSREQAMELAEALLSEGWIENE